MLRIEDDSVNLFRRWYIDYKTQSGIKTMFVVAKSMRQAAREARFKLAKENIKPVLEEVGIIDTRYLMPF